MENSRNGEQPPRHGGHHRKNRGSSEALLNAAYSNSDIVLYSDIIPPPVPPHGGGGGGIRPLNGQTLPPSLLGRPGEESRPRADTASRKKLVGKLLPYVRTTY